MNFIILWRPEHPLQDCFVGTSAMNSVSSLAVNLMIVTVFMAACVFLPSQVSLDFYIIILEAFQVVKNWNLLLFGWLVLQAVASGLHWPFHEWSVCVPPPQAKLTLHGSTVYVRLCKHLTEGKSSPVWNSTHVVCTQWCSRNSHTFSHAVCLWYLILSQAHAVSHWQLPVLMDHISDRSWSLVFSRNLATTVPKEISYSQSYSFWFQEKQTDSIHHHASLNSKLHWKIDVEAS